MPKPRALFAASVVAAVTGVVLWASFAQEASLIAPSPQSASSQGSSSVAQDQNAPDKSRTVDSPSEIPKHDRPPSIDQTIQTLSDQVETLHDREEPSTAKPVANLNSRISAMDADLAAKGISLPDSKGSANSSTRNAYEQVKSQLAKMQR